MSQENVELVRALYEAANRRDFERVASLLAPGFEYRSGMTDGRYFGRGAIREFVEEVDEVILDYRISVEQLIDAGDRVVASLVLAGTGRGSGTPASQHGHVVWTIADGELIRGTGYVELDDALRAAAVRP